MKIAFFIHDIYKTGGTERVTITLANTLSENNNEITIISGCNGNDVKFNILPDINIINLNSQKYKNSIIRKLKVYSSLNKIIQENNIDILICVDVTLYLYGFLLKKKVKVIAWEHFNYYHNNKDRIRMFSRKLAAKYADALVVLSKDDYNTYIKEIKKINKIKSIYNPLPFEVKKRSNLDNKTILAVGRYVYQKGFDILLQSWSKIQCDLPEWQLRIVGDGEDKKKLESIIEINEIKNVQLIPFTKNIIEEYSNADIFVLSSRFEGFGMVILEAQASGLPVVSFDCPYGPSELIDNNESGILVENGDENKLGKAILKLATNKDEIERISNNSLYSSRKFDISIILDMWEDLFNDILKC